MPQRLASSAASRSFCTSLWPTLSGAPEASAEFTSRATELSAGVISRREAGVA
ncbi:hypothetical protein SALBM311S_01796 [Streptomyces alboniger]